MVEAKELRKLLLLRLHQLQESLTEVIPLLRQVKAKLESRFKIFTVGSKKNPAKSTVLVFVFVLVLAM